MNEYVALYRHVTTSVCVITRYSTARRTSWTSHGELLRWLNTGPGGSKGAGTVRVRRSGWLDLMMNEWMNEYNPFVCVCFQHYFIIYLHEWMNALINEWIMKVKRPFCLFEDDIWARADQLNIFAQRRS